MLRITPYFIDLGEYPGSHMYMIYTNSENVPPTVHSALDAMGNYEGLKVADMLNKVVKSLDRATSGSRQNPVDVDDPDLMEIDSDNG